MTYSGLLDFSQLSNNSLCGLSNDEIQEIVDIRSFLRDEENLPLLDITESDFSNAQTSAQSSNASITLPSQVQSNLEALELSAIPTSTLSQQKRFSQKFTEFLKEKNFSSDFSNLSKSELCDILKYFYSELRTNDGKFYSPASLNCIRAALFRFFRQPPLSLDFDIINDVAFHSANQILKAMSKSFLESGGNVKRYESLEEADLKRLREYFDRSTPHKLQEEVYFSMIYFLGQRGREWIRHLKRSNVIISVDSTGRKYVEITNLNAVQKNRQPSVSKQCVDQKQSRIYQAENQCNCPVVGIETLITRLPENAEYLFYQPLKNWRESKCWYNANLVVGAQKLGNLMKTISQSANLSKLYTVHCIRATIVTEMFNNGAAVQDIQCVTGHKNSDSVKRYLKRVGDSKKQDFSRMLVSSFCNSTSSSVGPSHTESEFDDYLMKIAI